MSLGYSDRDMNKQCVSGSHLNFYNHLGDIVCPTGSYTVKLQIKWQKSTTNFIKIATENNQFVNVRPYIDPQHPSMQKGVRLLILAFINCSIFSKFPLFHNQFCPGDNSQFSKLSSFQAEKKSITSALLEPPALPGAQRVLAEVFGQLQFTVAIR